jgi:hypothetical protein
MSTYRTGNHTPLEGQEPPARHRSDEQPAYASSAFGDGATGVVSRVEDVSLSTHALNANAVFPPLVKGLVVPGPEPVRNLVDEFYLADRGEVASVGRLRQKIRYRAAVIARATLEAAAVTVFPMIVVAILHHLPPQPGASTDLPTVVQGLLHRVAPVAIAVMWARAGIKTLVVLAQSLMYTVAFHQRGFEVASGVLHRRKQFIWYYQITEEPMYVRTPIMFLTNTASLQVTYNHTANAAREMELSGIGSPREVEQIRAYLETRRLAERSPMRGALT